MHAQLALARRVAMALIVIGAWQVLATDRVQAGINQWTSNGPQGGPCLYPGARPPDADYPLCGHGQQRCVFYTAGEPLRRWPSGG